MSVAARTKAVGISPPAGRGINHPIHSSQQSLCGCAYVKSGYELFTAGFPRCSSTGVVRSVGLGARQGDVWHWMSPTTITPTETRQQRHFSVRESRYSFILARMCSRNNFLPTCLACAVKIPPSHLVLYQTFHIYAH